MEEEAAAHWARSLRSLVRDSNGVNHLSISGRQIQFSSRFPLGDEGGAEFWNSRRIRMTCHQKAKKSRKLCVHNWIYLVDMSLLIGANSTGRVPVDYSSSSSIDR
jgi:hypothetical protein